MKMNKSELQILASFKAKTFKTKLCSLLHSRCDSEGQDKFLKRIDKHAVVFFYMALNLEIQKNYVTLSEVISIFLEDILDETIVDNDFPAYRSGGIYKNLFPHVIALRVLATQCIGGNAERFLRALVQTNSYNIIYLIAYAKLLLEAKKFREAADVALSARRIATHDFCSNRIFNDTQKALIQNNIHTDIPITVNDNTHLFCEVPFVNLGYTLSNCGQNAIAHTLCHCSLFLPRVFEEDFSWNSKDVQEIRHSILDGSFKYCNEYLCVGLRDGLLPQKSMVTDPYLRDIIDNNRVVLPKTPRRLCFGYDLSCNMSCPSCRPVVHVASAETVKAFDVFMDKELPSILPNVQQIEISQVGEALASRHCLNILRSLTPAKYPQLEVELYTNMSLISERTWQMLGESAKCIKKIFMSVDGATPKTLEKLRRGLSWKRLMDAMHFVRALRLKGQLLHIRLNFVLQKDNFCELQQLLNLASEYCIDEVRIAPITFHGSYTVEEFNHLNVRDPKNPLHSEYLQRIKDIKHYHKQMLRNEKTIKSLGKTVPELYFIL